VVTEYIEVLTLLPNMRKGNTVAKNADLKLGDKVLHPNGTPCKISFMAHGFYWLTSIKDEAKLGPFYRREIDVTTRKTKVPKTKRR
jgi:hypothetical protein